jgi:hypothetical protein
MPGAEETKVMEMRLAGGGFDKLYPWDLVLEEGFSRLYRGELTALSPAKYTAAELSAVVDNGISMTIREKLADGKTYRIRYLNGIVTSVCCTGVFCEGTKNDCYTYIFVIEPELVRLKFTCFTVPYYRVNPADVFNSVIGKYKIPVQIKDEYISLNKFTKNLMFNQDNTPDYDFIDKIARLYGISFTFTHPAPSDSGAGAAELYFSNGEKFPVSLVTYSDKRKTDAILKFDFLSSDEGQNIWKMKRFSIAGGIGVDGFKLNAMYPSRNYGSEEWKTGKTAAGNRYLSYGSLFHGYDVDAESGEIDDDIKLILAAKARASDIARTRITGTAENIALCPGTILELRHFYGQRDGTVNTVLVTGIKLHRRARWPADLAVRTEFETGEAGEVIFSGIDWGKDTEKRFCPPLYEIKSI